MIKTIFLTVSIVLSLSGVEIEKAFYKEFHKKLTINSQIIQLTSSTISISPLIGGFIKEYFVQPAQKVKPNAKIAKIFSLELFKLTSNYLSTKKEIAIFQKNLTISQKLYKKGLLSIQTLNDLYIQKNRLLTKLQQLKKLLLSIGIDPNGLKTPKKEYILYSNSEGIIKELPLPLESFIKPNQPIVTLIKKEFYLQSYLPLRYITEIQKGDKIVSDYFGHKIVSYVEKVIPYTKNQQALLLSKLPFDQNLLLNAFIPSHLYLSKKERYIAIKASALTFINGNWAIFVPKEEEQEKEGEKDEHFEYHIKVVEILTKEGEYVGVKGIKENEEYVSKNSYYLKSLMLKSSLGEHED